MTSLTQQRLGDGAVIFKPLPELMLTQVLRPHIASQGHNDLKKLQWFDKMIG